ncbi:hypothetical protein EG329_004565 [Mollisiaceae sp. DMI_Dod_QoI]|nr:hypothetical protein EG329_004565 [Helotiales sp. DMI_Dod_QoI]
MSATYPRVRDACESCHMRKIRCLLEPGSTACQNCSISGSSCLFAPRAKAGRPRRTHLENHQRRKVSWNQAAIAKSSRTANEIGHTRSSSDSLVMVTTDDFGAIMGFDSYWDPGKMTSTQDSGSTDFLPHDNSTTQEHETQTALNEIVQQDRTQQECTLGVLTPSRSSTPPQYDMFVSADESLDFDTALKLCGDLDRSYRALRGGQTSTIEAEGTMKMVEYACTTARITASTVSAEKASTRALILAALYKVFELCESLVRQVINDSPNQDALDCLFRLKRLDFALLQGYIFLNHTGQADALKRTSELHTWIVSILQQQQYQTIW